MTDGSDLTVDFGDDTPPESFELAVPVKVTPKPRRESKPRPVVPASQAEEPERNLLGCIFVDGKVIEACQSAGVAPNHFESPQYRAIYATAERLHRDGHPVDQAIVAQELIGHEAFAGRNLFADIASAADSSATTAQAPYFIQKVREGHLRRAAIRRAKAALELAADPGADLSALEAASGISATAPRLSSRGLFDFTLPPAGDSSILVGNRYLSRGDGAILSSTSGMGKSSLTIQMATCWALGRPFHGGLQPNGPLRSLIFQSEDSDGDVAEVQLSVARGYELTAQECKEVNERARIVSDRVHRGGSFVQELRRQIDLHKPDIVWINPLLAFIGGDVNDAEAAGQFLREGLNSTNEPARHAFVIVHHTAKPPKEAKDRKWNEVMYDMAGSADLTNWARAIMSLRARDAEGEFDLVLAKRGRRAGFTCPSPSGAQRIPTTTVNLKHSKGRVQTPHGTEIPMIFWERFEAEIEEEAEGAPSGKVRGRPEKYPFTEFVHAMPAKSERPLRLSELHRRVTQNIPISLSSFYAATKRFVEDGMLEEVVDKGTKYYRMAV